MTPDEPASPQEYSDQYALIECENPCELIEAAFVEAGWHQSTEKLVELALPYLHGCRFQARFPDRRRVVIAAANQIHEGLWRLIVGCFRDGSMNPEAFTFAMRGHDEHGVVMRDPRAPRLSYSVACVIQRKLAGAVSSVRWALHTNPTPGREHAEPIPPHPMAEGENRGVHAVHGDSAAGALRLAIGEEGGPNILGLMDPLAVGPLLPTTSLEDWANQRRRYWADVVPEERTLELGGCLPNIHLLREAPTITVWLGNGLADQLTLPWLCWLLETLSISCAGLRVVRFPLDFVEYHGTPCLGAVSPERLGQHPPAQILTSVDLASLRSAWAALTASEPQALAEFLAGLEPSSPLRRLAFLSLRYPHAQTGLSFWDACLLSNVAAHAPRATAVVAHTMGGPGWEFDPVGDGWLFWRLLRLGTARVPLLRLTGNLSEMRGTNVELTDAGRSVLEGSLNALDLNPLDDWAGGVHLDSTTGGVWVTKTTPEEVHELPKLGLQVTWRPSPSGDARRN